MRSPLPLTLLCALAVLGGLACSKKPKADPYAKYSAPELLTQGRICLQNGKWDQGRKMLRSIEERLPSSPEFPEAKLLVADSFFYSTPPSYPEAVVEYKSYLGFFPKSALRDYALYRIGLCHYATIENAERDQAETRQAMASFQDLLRETPGSVYAVDAKAKITQCWRRLAESELMVGIYYVNSRTYGPAEQRLKELLETYPDYVDRERAYFYLAEALRLKDVQPEQKKEFQKEYLAKAGKDDLAQLGKDGARAYDAAYEAYRKEETARFRNEARSYYQKLVESYPQSVWAARASDRLVELGQAGLQEELDS